MGDGNGAQGRGQAALPHLIISVTDPALFKLQIAGSYPTLDYALNMLDQARRELEALWRLERAKRVMQEAADQELARQLMGGR